MDGFRNYRIGKESVGYPPLKLKRKKIIDLSSFLAFASSRTGSTCLEELRIHQCVKKDSGRRDSQAAGNEDKDGLVLNWADMPRVLKCAAKGTSLASRKPETAAVRSAAPGVARIKNKGARNGKGEQRKGKGNGKKGQKAKVIENAHYHFCKYVHRLLRASKSVGRRILCSSGTSRDGF